MDKLNHIERIGMENAVNSYQILYKRWKPMLRENYVMTTQEACQYLRISRPTFLKYLYGGKIRGAKAGKGWKVLRSELDRFLKGEISSSAMG
jgi:excisionase family DNA binding protein